MMRRNVARAVLRIKMQVSNCIFYRRRETTIPADMVQQFYVGHPNTKEFFFTCGKRLELLMMNGPEYATLARDPSNFKQTLKLALYHHQTTAEDAIALSTGFKV